jgi:hypothetical protein
MTVSPLTSVKLPYRAPTVLTGADIVVVILSSPTNEACETRPFPD